MLGRDANPLMYWTEEKEKSSPPAKVVRKCPEAQCSSAASEQLFSCTVAVAYILDDTRKGLFAEDTEKLLLLNKNLSLSFSPSDDN